MLPTTGMFAGAALLGVHMALTHSITISMVASYMPTGEVRGLGKISGTAVSFTDLMLGEGAYFFELSGNVSAELFMALLTGRVNEPSQRPVLDQGPLLRKSGAPGSFVSSTRPVLAV